MIERTHFKLSVGAQCQLLSISRSSFYYAPQGETAMNLDLMLLIDKQFLETPFYGVRQMTWHLQNEDHAVNEKRIRRLMRLMRLMPIYQKPNASNPAKGHKTYPYLLGGLRIAGTSEFSAIDAAPNWQRAETLARLASGMFPGLRLDGYSRWSGYRPSTPDSLPVIGRSPRHAGVFLALGHGHWGLMAAPATGQVIADLVAGRPPRLDIAPFRPDRF